MKKKYYIITESKDTDYYCTCWKERIYFKIRAYEKGLPDYCSIVQRGVRCTKKFSNSYWIAINGHKLDSILQ